MFKKIILILILSLIPTNSFAQENYENVDWINFDWDRVIPDQYTINLAKMYGKIDRSIKESNQTIEIDDSHILNKNNLNYLEESANFAASFFNFNDIEITVIDENGTNYFYEKFINLDKDYANFYNKTCNVKENKKTCGVANFNHKKISFYFNSSYFLSKTSISAGIFHDIAHIYGFSLRDKNKMYLKNCWVDEGIANAIGFAAMAFFKDPTEERKNQILLLNNFPIKISNENKTKIINLFKYNQNNEFYCFSGDILMSYSIGMLLMEYLYINYEINQVNDFLYEWGQLVSLEYNLINKANPNYKDLNNDTKSMNIALFNNLGITEEQFYDQAFDYVIESYKKSLTE